MHINRLDARKTSHNELSAGGVVYRRGRAGLEVLLIRSSRESDKEKWTFPKGWIGDHGLETKEEAALREVREEGGVEAKIVDDLGAIHYVFTWEGQLVRKTVHYYLMEYVAGDPADHDREVAEARFVPLSAVQDMLSYDTDKRVFAKTAERLIV